MTEKQLHLMRGLAGQEWFPLKKGEVLLWNAGRFGMGPLRSKHIEREQARCLLFEWADNQLAALGLDPKMFEYRHQYSESDYSTATDHRILVVAKCDMDVVLPEGCCPRNESLRDAFADRIRR